MSGWMRGWEIWNCYTVGWNGNFWKNEDLAGGGARIGVFDVMFLALWDILNDVTLTINV